MRLVALLAAPLVLAAAAGAAGLFYLQSQGVAPRALAPYVLKRSSGHNPLIEAAGRFAATTLWRLDRGAVAPYVLPALTLGAQSEGPASPHGRDRLVTSADEARQAIATAVPGDVITFLPGAYAIAGTVYARQAGTADAPIVVRAADPGTVTIALDGVEGFAVSAPYWRFENLTIQGACGYAGDCEHAFHVVGNAHHFVARNNTIRDFNAHFKINGHGGSFPDHGLIESNTLDNSAPRPTAHPVTPIDLVAASDWTIRANLIMDFVKAEGDGVSYGVFAKGGAQRTVFERNVVLCERALTGQPGQRVGLSFGGGGTGKPYCRDGRCITEHDGGIMRANLVSGCSDAGIYLNSSATTQVLDNTLLDTAGVQVRFPESGATFEGNLVDGPLQSRDGGVLRVGDNLSTDIAWLYLGRHPQRGRFADPGQLDLRWSDGSGPQRAERVGNGDLCKTAPQERSAYGAFDDFAACLRPAPRLQSRGL
ncbi:MULTISPECIES: right-handed parallel beta-helix repeat-containing protein [unclassified Massilia]|uniref:right-handed parallel beta-helix repeat-containing protein n=1 Tax=unclassified Massilia TaxID=2609279 RepID=UPI00177FE10B|nr:MULTISPECIES: right-handed parallel beta-helix repeat-containing protein [unclassified Massilia]MBD8531356.1 right-handed parallel beta-helix repeat-containing protein [Massilia sp. CFBP 13647]MBD8674389.1 right-handed parallel beta-helix repeat-containing protein [Massilia sp. CFBP 13721]